MANSEDKDCKKIGRLIAKYCWIEIPYKDKDSREVNVEQMLDEITEDREPHVCWSINQDDDEPNTYVVDICPSRKEIVGGKSDGKESSIKFIFEYRIFSQLMKKHNYKILSVAFTNHFEDDFDNGSCMSMTLSKKNKNIAVRVHGRPSKYLKIVYKEKSF